MKNTIENIGIYDVTKTVALELQEYATLVSIVFFKPSNPYAVIQEVEIYERKKFGRETTPLVGFHVKSSEGDCKVINDFRKSDSSIDIFKETFVLTPEDSVVVYLAFNNNTQNAKELAKEMADYVFCSFFYKDQMVNNALKKTGTFTLSEIEFIL